MLTLAPLRVPSGWMIEINGLYEGLEQDNPSVALVMFSARHEGRRFRIQVDALPERDHDGGVVLVVYYQPWPRTDRGRRRRDVPFAFGPDEETVEIFRTRSYGELLDRLHYWLDRCAVWCREGN